MHSHDASYRSRGMTLVEVIAALALAGIILLGGVMLLDQVSDSGERIVSERWAQAGESNAIELTRRLLRDATPSFDSTRLFRGASNSLDYYARCRVPAGWFENCHMTLAVDAVRDTAAVMAQFDGGEQFTVLRRAGSIAFRYFDFTSADSAWSARWTTSATTPSALAIISALDTVVLPIGPSRE
jgi:prepilin-type N-terminal cleavage/methylation domain-containing protein